MYEITVEQFEQLDNSAYILIDIRDELAFSYGHLPQAVNIPVNEIDIDMNDEEKESNIFSLLNYVDNCFKEKSFSKIIIYCKKGIASDIVVSFMAQIGRAHV